MASRYFWVELLNGSLWAAIWYQHLLVRWEPAIAIAYFLGVSALVAIIFIDAELYIIPDELNASLLFIGLGFAFFTGGWDLMLKGAVTGWGVIWGIALLGGVLLRQQSMGDGDIKMMRGVGTILFPLLTAASVGLAVPLGLIGGLSFMAVGYLRKTRGAKPDPEDPAAEDGAAPDPFIFRDWLITGIYYLLCLDVLALFIPTIERSVLGMLQNPGVADEGLEEDEWVPGATTIPFGPYLAAGAVVCMLFGGWVEGGLKAYWRHATGSDVRSAALEWRQRVSLRSGASSNWIASIEDRGRTAGVTYSQNLHGSAGEDQRAFEFRLQLAGAKDDVGVCLGAQEERRLTVGHRNIGTAQTVTQDGESRADYA